MNPFEDIHKRNELMKSYQANLFTEEVNSAKTETLKMTPEVFSKSILGSGANVYSSEGLNRLKYDLQKASVRTGKSLNAEDIDVFFKSLLPVKVGDHFFYVNKPLDSKEDK